MDIDMEMPNVIQAEYSLLPWKGCMELYYCNILIFFMKWCSIKTMLIMQPLKKKIKNCKAI